MTTIWIDAHLSPAIATWINNTFEDISAFALRDLGLRDAEDWEIFEAAKAQGVIDKLISHWISVHKTFT